jgi:hypothetical protein
LQWADPYQVEGAIDGLVIRGLRRDEWGSEKKNHCVGTYYCVSTYYHVATLSLLSSVLQPKFLQKRTQSQDSFTGFLVTNGNHSQGSWLQMRTIHSSGSSPQQYMFYIHSTQVPQQRTRRTALIQSWSSHINSCFHYYMISTINQ